jgi:hypothetical protein
MGHKLLVRAACEFVQSRWRRSAANLEQEFDNVAATCRHDLIHLRVVTCAGDFPHGN